MLYCHWMIGKQKIWQAENCRECREEEDDKRTAFPVQAQLSYHGVCRASAKAAERTDQRRTGGQGRKARLDDA